MPKLKKLYMGTNTKMYKTIADTEQFVTELSELTADIPRDELELFVIPSFTALSRARQCAAPERIHLGAQNMGWEKEGQFSGEISPVMLREVGTEMVMIGHSERRHIFGETDEMENRKVICALNNELIPLLCIGETKEEKESGISDEVLRIQLKRGLADIGRNNACKIRIAYEPVWAIGVGGTPAKTEYAAEKHAVIRECLCELFGGEIGRSIPILYGGSVNAGNACELISADNIDGLFIGRSAWQADRFNNIIRDVLQTWKMK